MENTEQGRELTPGSRSHDGSRQPPARSQPNKKKKVGKILGISIGCVALAAVILAVAILLPIVLGPLVQTGIAVAKTVDKGSFYFTASYSTAEGSTKAQGQVELDLENRQISAWITLRSDQGEVRECILYRNHWMTQDSHGKWTARDCTGQIQGWFDALEKQEKVSLRQALQQMNVLNLVEGYLDVEKLEKTLPRFLLKLNEEDWLEEHAGYTRDKRNGTTYYMVDAGAMELLEATLREFQPCFLDQEFFRELKTEVRKRQGATDTPVMLKVGIRKGVLRHVVAEFGDREWQLWLEDVGKTRIDTARAEKIFQDAEKITSGD